MFFTKYSDENVVKIGLSYIDTAFAIVTWLDVCSCDIHRIK